MLVICSTFDLVPMGLEVPGKGGQIILCTIEFSISKLDFLLELMSLTLLVPVEGWAISYRMLPLHFPCLPSDTVQITFHSLGAGIGTNKLTELRVVDVKACRTSAHVNCIPKHWHLHGLNFICLGLQRRSMEIQLSPRISLETQ